MRDPRIYFPLSGIFAASRDILLRTLICELSLLAIGVSVHTPRKGFKYDGWNPAASASELETPTPRMGQAGPMRGNNYFFTGAVFMLGSVFMGSHGCCDPVIPGLVFMDSPGLLGTSGMGTHGGVAIPGLSVGWTVPGFDRD